jgi:hypothetical protein
MLLLLHIYKQKYFCDGMRQNTIPKVISQKDASQNSGPESFFFWHG